ncbi:MAG: hypothetical protein E6L04_10525 [Thaumarchaeota archaeon]|nr:MAG: hypothetical protein E6L04_10525 [Nitrososphaerota archaeon]
MYLRNMVFLGSLSASAVSLISIAFSMFLIVAYVRKPALAKCKEIVNSKQVGSHIETLALSVPPNP